MAEEEGKALKVAVGILLVALLVFGFIRLQTPKPPTPATPIEAALLEADVPFDRVLVSNGSEVARAFGLNRTTIPGGLKIAVVIMKEPFADADIGVYRKAMNAALDADQGIDGVMLFVALGGQDAFLIYSNRTLAESLRSQDLQPAALFGRWYVLKFTMER